MPTFVPRVVCLDAKHFIPFFYRPICLLFPCGTNFIPFMDSNKTIIFWFQIIPFCHFTQSFNSLYLNYFLSILPFILPSFTIHYLHSISSIDHSPMWYTSSLSRIHYLFKLHTYLWASDHPMNQEPCLLTLQPYIGNTLYFSANMPVFLIGSDRPTLWVQTTLSFRSNHTFITLISSTPLVLWTTELWIPDFTIRICRHEGPNSHWALYLFHSFSFYTFASNL